MIFIASPFGLALQKSEYFPTSVLSPAEKNIRREI